MFSINLSEYFICAALMINLHVFAFVFNGKQISCQLCAKIIRNGKLNLCLIFSLSSGKSESNANLAEGLATALVCFDDMNELRDDKSYPVQNHCILLCNSAPYAMPVTENVAYENKTVEQMAVMCQEVGRICFTMISQN